MPPTLLYETYQNQNLNHRGVVVIDLNLASCLLSSPAVHCCPKQSVETRMAFVALLPMNSASEAMAAVTTAEGGRAAHHDFSTAWRQQQKHQWHRKCGTCRLRLLSLHAASRAATTSAAVAAAAAAAAATMPTPTIMASTSRLPFHQRRVLFRGLPSLSMAVDPKAELHAGHTTPPAKAQRAAAAVAAGAVQKGGALGTARTAVTAEAPGVQAGAAKGTRRKPGGFGQAIVRHTPW